MYEYVEHTLYNQSLVSIISLRNLQLINLKKNEIKYQEKVSAGKVIYK